MKKFTNIAQNLTANVFSAFFENLPPKRRLQLEIKSLNYIKAGFLVESVTITTQNQKEGCETFNLTFLSNKLCIFTFKTLFPAFFKPRNITMSL